MQTPTRKGVAVTDPASHVRLWATVVAGVALDLLSKYAAWATLGGPPDEGGRQVVLLPGWLRLVAGRNTGIVFGIRLSEMLALGPAAGQALTLALTAATVALIFYVFAVSPRGSRWIPVWCGLILAGALGNLYDRLAFGYVRDLIQFTGRFRVAGLALEWPYVFNIADVYLSIGVIAVALAFLFGRQASAGLPSQGGGSSPPPRAPSKDSAHGRSGP